MNIDSYIILTPNSYSFSTLFNMHYSIVSGNLLEATTEYIVQQNCCTALKAQGLSAAIATKWPEANPYKDRRRLKGNWSILADRPSPGSILVYEMESSEPIKGIICAFAQVCHGKPGVLKDPLGDGLPDSSADRQSYFKDCLEAIATLQPKSVGFPYKIGCGLAGGSWVAYERILREWSVKYPSITVILYKME